MEASTGQQNDAFAGEARGELSPRTARALWCGSAGLVIAALGVPVSVAGAEDGRRLIVATALVVVQIGALKWQTRAPVPVLAANAATGIAVWALLPAVTLTGALLAAQVTLCVLSATRPRQVSLWALAAMCLPVPLAFGAGGSASPAVYVLAVVLAWTLGQWRRAQQERMRAETRRAVVEERARIARDVHDVVAHTLSVMVVQAGAADDVFTERPDQARQALRDIEGAARSALGELRLTLRAFAPEAGEGVAGEPRTPGPSLTRLDELADTVRATGMTVHVHREGAADGLPAAVDLTAYRIIQEALTNTLRHAVGADEVSVRVMDDGHCLEITVVDNGRTAQGLWAGAGAGRGLVGMKERTRLVGGSLHAGPRPGGGFEVAARLPVERAS
ncbi:Two-component system sensor kinase [Streptomyces hygroscopicus subsp. limoneus]|nr:Two-component system sensor kinase [Streptomyces hygroscopicus subsp. limoneus]